MNKLISTDVNRLSRTMNEFYDEFLDKFASYLQLIVYLIAFFMQIPPQMRMFSLRTCTETSQDSG